MKDEKIVLELIEDRKQFSQRINQTFIRLFAGLNVIHEIFDNDRFNTESQCADLDKQMELAEAELNSAYKRLMGVMNG